MNVSLWSASNERDISFLFNERIISEYGVLEINTGASERSVVTVATMDVFTVLLSN